MRRRAQGKFPLNAVVVCCCLRVAGCLLLILVFCCVVWITSRGELEEPPHSSKQKEIPLQDCHVGFVVNLSSVAAKHAKATLWTSAAVSTHS